MLESLGNTDIYLLDQIMRGRITRGMNILDAGCGSGRNSELLIRQGCKVWGIDISTDAIGILKQAGKDWGPAFDTNNFAVADLKEIPFEDARFDVIICSAVLHFAQNRDHFTRMFKELVRVLKPGGLLWIRMTTTHTIEGNAVHVQDDIYDLPDGSRRYLLGRKYLKQLMHKHSLYFIDPYKTVNVDDVRTMCVLALEKKRPFENLSKEPFGSPGQDRTAI